MKTMYDDQTLQEAITRINKLTPDAKALWGKMQVAQMLAHVVETFRMATGDVKNSRLLLGRILGPIFKKDYLSEKPFRKNSPTHKNFIVTGTRNFEIEKQQLINIMTRFSEGGPAKATTQPHSFFGKFTPEEWGISMYKHLNHHLEQFGA